MPSESCLWCYFLVWWIMLLLKMWVPRLRRKVLTSLECVIQLNLKDAIYWIMKPDWSYRGRFATFWTDLVYKNMYIWYDLKRTFWPSKNRYKKRKTITDEEKRSTILLWLTSTYFYLLLASGSNIMYRERLVLQSLVICIFSNIFCQKLKKY